MIEERLMKVGRWGLKLKDDTPKSVRDLLKLETSGFGHIAITPTRLDDTTLTSALVLAASRYTGVYRERPSEYEMSGPGPGFWLGDENHKGDVLEAALTKSGGTFVQWITDLRPISLIAGTYNAVGGALSHTFLLLDRRTALDYLCDYFGAEWKVTPNLKLHGGTAAQLFVSSPTAVVQRRAGGRDPNVTGIRADLDTAKDYDDYATRVVVVAGGAGAGSSMGAAQFVSPFKDVNGNAVILTEFVESSDTVAGNEAAVATTLLTDVENLRRAVKLSSDAYDIGADIKPGDSIYVWDEQLDLYDTANPLQYRGDLIFPISLRCLAYSWPVQQGMGVYFRAPDAGGTITDLSDWVVFETGTTSIEVGAQARAATDATLSSLQRPAALGPQGSLGYVTDPNRRAGISGPYDVPNLSKVVKVGPLRRIRITAHLYINSLGGGFIGMVYRDGSFLGYFAADGNLNGFRMFDGFVIDEAPAAGSHTYKVTVLQFSGASLFDIYGDVDVSRMDIVDEGIAA